MVTPPGADEVDLVVVGLGAAGAAAAMTAADLGARVLVVEKGERPGGSTAASGGNLRLVADRDLAVLHLEHIAGAGVTRPVIDAFVDGLVDLPAWLRGLGAELVAHDEFSEQALDVARAGSIYAHLPGGAGLGSRVKVRGPAGTSGGEALWHLLEHQVTQRDIPVRTATRATRLVLEDGQVTGVRLAHAGRTQTVRARGGVLLACGGFAWDSALLEDALGAALGSMSPVGLNDGDGIRLAQQAGAALWHMNAVTARYGFRFDGHEAAFRSTPPDQGMFLVDQDGRRYVDETGVDGHSAALVMLERDPRTGLHRRLPSHLVFDEQTRLAGPLGRQSSGHNRGVPWSRDNSVEVGRGWIVRADTLAELADRIGVPREALQETARAYDEACTADNDVLGRPSRLMRRLAAPYYAVPLQPVLLNTQGGPRRNERSEILDSALDPIPGLYGAGELGALWGELYPGAVSIAEALITGRIAAQSAVARARGSARAHATDRVDPRLAGPTAPAGPAAQAAPAGPASQGRHQG